MSIHPPWSDVLILVGFIAFISLCALLADVLERFTDRWLLPDDEETP